MPEKEVVSSRSWRDRENQTKGKSSGNLVPHWTQSKGTTIAMYVVALRVLIVIWLLHETISANRVLHQSGKTREIVSVGRKKGQVIFYKCEEVLRWNTNKI